MRLHKKSATSMADWQMRPFDVYLAHAWEDKDVVEPVAAALRRLGWRVWLDSLELIPGQSLRSQLDKGMRESEFGALFFSRNFFNPAKSYTAREFDAWITASESAERLLPVWVRIDKSEVLQASPIAASLFALIFREDVELLAADLAGALQRKYRASGSYGHTLRGLITENIDWIRPPEFDEAALRTLTSNLPYFCAAAGQPHNLGGLASAQPLLGEVVEDYDRYKGMLLHLTGRQVGQQCLMRDMPMQEFSVRLLTNDPAFAGCLAVAFVLRISGTVLPVPAPPTERHLPLLTSMLVGRGGALMHGSDFNVLLLMAARLTYVSLDASDIREWPSV